jgi:hypothetical protein
MKTRVWIITLLLCTGIGRAHAADWQLVLLKPDGCAYCVYVEQILKGKSQLRQAELADGAGGKVTASIQRRGSAVLSAQEWQELRALPWFDESLWRQRTAANAAQVLLKRDGIIVSAGDITDTADLRGARYPADLVTPDTGRDPGSVREAQSAYISNLQLRSWDLSWFYRLALDPTILRSRSGAAWIAAKPAALEEPLGPANVMLMSTASGAADNEIFNMLRIEEIRDVLSPSLLPDPKRLRIFYGGGTAAGANALEVRDGQIDLVRRKVADASPFTPDAALQIFQSMRAQPGSRNLLVLIGHGNPDGAGMWSSPTPLSPATLRALHEHSGGDNVLVSGNCFGGVMAQATSCGFFGARPDIIATGCQADAAEVAQSRDYLHMFFSSLTSAARAAADADGNGAISFAEAHWYASTEGDPRNVTYTSIDALADAYFDSHPDALPAAMVVRDLRTLATSAPPAEARALRSVVNAFNGDLPIPLGDLAGQAKRWRPNAGEPRALVAQLARRLLFLKNPVAGSTELARYQSCENRSVAAFLQP